ncbi:MAG: hypothetical protein HC805_04425 [Alkalinema sp. RL_2_19]|nr:hypothetical protein [Alkalinema sp. RL_2_19]
MRGELRGAIDRANDWQERYGQLVDPLRDLPLERVAEGLCLQSDLGVSPRWCHQGHQIRINGSKFFDWHEGQMTGGRWGDRSGHARQQK